MPIDPTLLALAGIGLPAAPALVRDGWDGRLDAAFVHGLAGFLHAARAAGLIELDERSGRSLDLRVEAEAIRAVQLEGELIRLEPALATLPAVILGGATLARGAYPDPLLRPFAGLDLLVASRCFGAAVETLEGLGYAWGPSETARRVQTTAGDSAVSLFHPGGVVVDVHCTIGTGTAAEPRQIDELLAAHQRVVVGPALIPGPSWEAQLVATALHVVVGDGPIRALSLRDVAQIALHPDLDAARAVDLARRWEVPAPVAHAVRAAIEGIGLRPPPALVAMVDQHPAPVLNPPDPRSDEEESGASRSDDTVQRGFERSTATLSKRSPDDAGVRTVKLPDRAPRVAITHRRLHRSDGPAGASPVLRPPRQRQWSHERAPRRTSGNGNGNGNGNGLPPGNGRPPPPGADGGPPTDVPEAPERSSEVRAVHLGPAPSSGVPWFFAGAGLLTLTAIVSQLGVTSAGTVLIPVAAVLLAVAASRRIRRTHPDEAWVGRWLVLGVVAKLTASYLRYLTLVVGYEGVGDASGYDRWGQQLASGWLGDGNAPELPDLRRTNFIRFFTGVVYYVFGSSMVAGFFVFGLLALVGSYLWYRATVEAVPAVHKRLYLGVMLFAPSIVFWPSSIGKESLMQLGIGTMALGTAFLLRQRLLLGLAVGMAGGWVLWLVRPHLLALVTVAAGCAYLAGRVRAGDHGVRGLVGRPVGLLTVALLMSFTVSQGAKFLGIDDLSLSSIEAELDEQTERSAQGGSEFEHSGNSLSPLRLPSGAVTVLLRPFPWETDTPLQLLSSLESIVLAVFIAFRLPSLRTALARARTSPFLLYCWILTLLYAATFSSFANFGLLVRQRSLVLPALFVLLAVSPVRDRAQRRGDLRPAPAPQSVRARS